MTISIDKQIKTINSLKMYARLVCDETQDKYLTHKEMLGLRRILVFREDTYQTLPLKEQRYIDGYMDALIDKFEESYLEDLWELDGKLYPYGQERDQVFEGRWNDVKYVGRFHKGHPDKPYYLMNEF